MDTEVQKHVIHDAIRQCLRIKMMTSEARKQFRVYLKNLMKQVWTVLGLNKCVDSDSWLLHSKVAFIGLHYLCQSNESFLQYVNRLCRLEEDDTDFFIREFDLHFHIDTPDTFKAAVYHGVVRVLLIKQDLYTNNLKYIYEFILQKCRQQTRYYQLYFQTLTSFVSVFADHLTDADYDNLLDTVYYNLEKRDCSTLLSKILNKTTKTSSVHIFISTFNHMSWKYKQKYSLLNAILKYDASLFNVLCHEECIRGLIIAQSHPYLSSAGTKLYITIVKHISDELWMEKYYPTLEEEISHSKEPTLCQKNIFKNYLSFQVYHRGFFHKILKKLFLLEELPIYSVLKLTNLGIKYSLIVDNYNFDVIIDMGLNHPDSTIRNMAFEIICGVKDIHSIDTFKAIRSFITLNLNEADQQSRISLKSSYELFMKKLENGIVRLQRISDHEPIVRHSKFFFNWLIPYLLNQFTRFSNYKRVSLSSALLCVTLTYFSRNKVQPNSGYVHKLRIYRRGIKAFKGLSYYFHQFINMLQICDSDETQKIIHLLITELNYNQIGFGNVIEVERLGMKFICNSNVEVAENGQKILSFVHRVKTVKKQWDIFLLKDIMFRQWNEIKHSNHESVVEMNPLHPLITIVTSSIDFYESSEYEQYLSFLEDVVANLLNVFSLRAMLPFTGKYCIGVAKAFKDESSKYHACSINCMWLVLKASCKLAGNIARICQTDDMMCRTLILINSIIQKCYHKGALEVAGETMAIIVSCATLKNYGVSVIDDFLKKIFKSIPEATEATSTVRRAAETRIMLSAIAINDKRIHKPFLHKTMNFLIKTLNFCLTNRNIERNVPVHSLALHCLQPLMTDNSVELFTAQYVSEVAIMSLTSFELSNWTVRNAALQTFGALSNKLLGTALTSNENSSHHAVCLEEIIYMNPHFCHYIIGRLKEATFKPQENINLLVPILSFLSMSYARDDILVSITRNEMEELYNVLVNYMDSAPNVNTFILAAKALSTLCYHRHIKKEMQRVRNDVLRHKNFDNNHFFMSTFLLKVLSDKIIEDIATFPHSDNVEPGILKTVDAILKQLPDNNTFFQVIAGVLLYRPGLKYVDPEKMLNNLLYLCEVQNLAILPGIWECIEYKLKLILMIEKMPRIIKLITICLEKNIPINLKVACLKTVKERILKCADDKNICEQQLMNFLIELLFNTKLMRFKHCVEEIITLLIHLDASLINNEMINKTMHNVNAIRHKLIPNYYLPAFCWNCENLSSDEANMAEFLECVVMHCLQIVQKENPDFFIFKSLKFICKFAIRHKKNELIIQTLLVLYKMMQRGDEEFKEECDIVFSLCLEIKPKHSYANILELIQRRNLIELIDPCSALKFLVSIYCERNDTENLGINVFDHKHILETETFIIEDQILRNIRDILKYSLKDLTEFNIWFNEYKEGKDLNNYIQIITNDVLQ